MKTLQKAIDFTLLGLLVCCAACVDSPSVARPKQIDKPIASFEGLPPIMFSPDGNWLAQLRAIRDTATWKSQTKSPNEADYWDKVQDFSPDSKLLAIGSREGTIHVYDVPAFTPRMAFATDHGSITGLAFTADGKAIIAACFNKKIGKWPIDFERKESNTEMPLKMQVPMQRYMGTSGDIDAFAISPDRTQFAVSNSSFTRIISAEDLHEIRTFKNGIDKFDPVNAVSFSPNGKQLLVVSAAQLHVHSIETGIEPLEIKTEHKHYHTSGSWCQSGRVVVVLYYAKSSNSVLEFFDVDSQKSLGAFVPHGNLGPAGSQVMTSPDGTLIATTGARSGLGKTDIRIWNIDQIMQKLYPTPLPVQEDSPN